MSQADYSIQPESTTTQQAKSFQFNNRSPGGAFNETGGMEGFGHEESQMFGGNITTPGDSTTDLSKLNEPERRIQGYGQTLYKKGSAFAFGNKDGMGQTQLSSAAAGNKNEIWGMEPEAQLRYFQNYTLTVRDLFSMEQLLNHPDLKMKKYKSSIYYGVILNGKRHGFGIMIYQNDRVYEGVWENDLKHGRGYEYFQSGSNYDGYYINGKPEGRGTYLYANGEIYEGEWINGMKHGSGIWRGSKADSYIGEWKFGKTDGYGVHTWLNGDRYEGQFKQCLKHGEGTEKFANGDSYVGNYQNGKPEGYGEYYWSNGSFFKGYFKNGLRHGKGVWKRGPGNTDIYEGEYFNDKKCGTGVFTWASGNIYRGNYFDDLRHGYGEMYWTDNSYYKGTWERGIQHGEGEMCMKGEHPRKGLFENNVYIGPLDDAGGNGSPQKYEKTSRTQGARSSQVMNSQPGRTARQNSSLSKGLDRSYQNLPIQGGNNNHSNNGNNNGNPKYSLPSISRNHPHARSSSIQSQSTTLGYMTQENFDTSGNRLIKKNARPSSTIHDKSTNRSMNTLNDRGSGTAQNARGNSNGGNAPFAFARIKVQKSIGRLNGAQSSRSISPRYKQIDQLKQSLPKKIWRSPGIAGLRGRVSPL